MNFIVGATYNVTVNGTTYTGECIYDANNFEAKIIVWDEGQLSPYIPILGTSAYLPNSATVGDSVVIEVVLAADAAVKIDSKYIPDMSSGLPESTTDDNGKVLTVSSDGTAVWQTPASGLPTVSSADDGKVLRVVGDLWAISDEAVELPTVDADDNNKVLTVVGGEWIAQTPVSDLPEVTTDDVGKFLRVDLNGTWVAETIRNAEEVGF